ncbi:CAP domain-containing protein [Paracoccus nototheniae]|uniref:CAP domain-containing protein n=1 Tax=Paracoccus nototheniae TaxID=2489002 RepID=A0ABW4DPX1_9RHOB|nr:CAP domain-containing protein [Paracoccus nototheniae]
MQKAIRVKAGLAMMLCGVLAAGCAGTAPTGAKGTDPHAVQVGAPGAATCRPTTASENATGAAVTNQLRQQAGLAGVAPNPQLARVAAAHACDMAQRGRMTHLGDKTTGPAMRLKQAGYQPTISAENIAAGPYSLPRVLAEWNASPGHQANIMLPQVRDYGVGQALGPDGRTVYWAAVYSAPR